MLIIIIVAAVVVLIGLGIFITGGKNKGVKKVASILEKAVGQTPDYNASFLAGQKNPEITFKVDQLNFNSSGEKFQQFLTTIGESKAEITLFYDEQKRCQNYLIKKFTADTSYNRVYEEFWRESLK